MITALFIVKRGQISGGSHHRSITSSGLRNSAQFVVDMLNGNGVRAILEEAFDGNDIDRLVTRWHPDIVVLEAIWCPPSKLAENVRLHPSVVKWIVRLHSEITFLAVEGMAIKWTREYQAIDKVFVSCNSDRTTEDMEVVVEGKVLYLPNYYLPNEVEAINRLSSSLHIGCFGAIRPMKNQLIQAVAAIRFARSKTMYFHVNGGRVEQGGEQVLKNLRALFAGRQNAHLIEHEWMEREAFLTTMSMMDLSMAVSLTESFNIVTADAVMCNVPIVVSKEVRWADPCLYADPTSTDSIVHAMRKSTGMFKSHFRHSNRKRLKEFNEESQKLWLKMISGVRR